MKEINSLIELVARLPKVTIRENGTEWLNLCTLGKAISVNKVDSRIHRKSNFGLPDPSALLRCV